MIRGRSAILVLIASILLGAGSRGSQSTATSSPSARIHGGLFALSSSSSGWIASFRVSRRATTLSQFIPWKSRVKIVLEERVHQDVDERDLGPVMRAGTAIIPARSAPAATSVFKLTPLRC